MADSLHLTGDDFDALLNGTAAAPMLSHLEQCGSCRAAADLDAGIVTALERLPLLTPSPMLADRVMRQVIIRRPAPYPTLAESSQRTAREVAAERRLLVGGVSGVGAIAALLGLALAYPGEALRWINPNLQRGVESLWAWLQALPTELSAQSWHLPASGALDTPSRVVVVVCLAGALYAVGLVGFRHLLTESAPDATV